MELVHSFYYKWISPADIIHCLGCNHGTDESDIAGWQGVGSKLFVNVHLCGPPKQCLVFPANRRAGTRRKGGRGTRGTHRLLAATDLRSTSRRPGASGGNSSMQLRSWGSGSSMWSEMNNLFPSCQIHHPKPLYTAIVFWSQSVSVCIMSIIPTMMAIPMIGGCCECPRYE